jgi:hypothetical protein
MRGTGEYADLLGQRFPIALRRFGLSREAPVLDVNRFRVLPKTGDPIHLFEEYPCNHSFFVVWHFYS